MTAILDRSWRCCCVQAAWFTPFMTVGLGLLSKWAHLAVPHGLTLVSSARSGGPKGLTQCLTMWASALLQLPTSIVVFTGLFGAYIGIAWELPPPLCLGDTLLPESRGSYGARDRIKALA